MDYNIFVSKCTYTQLFLVYDFDDEIAREKKMIKARNVVKEKGKGVNEREKRVKEENKE